MAEANFNFYLNRQGVRGQQGPVGPQGFSPIITEYTNTLSEYVLQIQTQNNVFLTANLREHKEDLGGTYIRYNRETGVMYAGFAEQASQETVGMARFSTATEVLNLSETTIATPYDVSTIIGSSEVTGDVADLKLDVAANSDAIADLQSSVSGLLDTYVPKTRTINGHALSSNVSLTANDVGALPSSTQIPSKTSDLTNDSGFITSAALPDMTNYYNKTETNTLLSGKADVSDIPTVGNGTITFTQGGVSKGTITTNQSSDTTITLDEGSQYILPPATTSTLGGVIADGITITIDSNGVISSSGGGGGGTTYNPGNGININTSTNTISAKVDGSTLKFDSSGNLAVDTTTVALKSDLSSYALITSLATVATSGDYSDLINKPTIPDITALQAVVEAQADLITQLFYRVNALENSINGGNSNLTGAALPAPSNLMMMSPSSLQGLSLPSPDLEINDFNANSEDNMNSNEEEDI